MEPPRVTSTRLVYENRWMRLHEDRTESADGRPGLYAWVEKPPAAVILPIDGGDVWLVEQFRHPPKARFWEFPQGAWEDAPGADPEELARGELVEETGLRAQRMERLGRLFFAYGMSDQYFDVWLATGLEPGPQRLELTEHGLRSERFALADVERMIGQGAIADAASVAAFGLWHLRS
jgi:8-oxo-dGTP pyrophosphatase MutT (NUDIX family)